MRSVVRPPRSPIWSLTSPDRAYLQSPDKTVYATPPLNPFCLQFGDRTPSSGSIHHRLFLCSLRDNLHVNYNNSESILYSFIQKFNVHMNQSCDYNDQSHPKPHHIFAGLMDLIPWIPTKVLQRNCVKSFATVIKMAYTLRNLIFAKYLTFFPVLNYK